MGKFNARNKDIPTAKPGDVRVVRRDGKIIVAEVKTARRTQIEDALKGLDVSDVQLAANVIDYVESDKNKAQLAALRASLQQGADDSSD